MNLKRIFQIGLPAALVVVGLSTFAVSQNFPGLIATDKLLGRDTAGTGQVEQIGVTGGIEFTGSKSIQTGAFTGDVTKTAGGTVTALTNAAVTYAKIQNLGALSLMGRSANSSGVGADIAASAGSSCAYRESSSTIGCGTLATAAYAANSVTNAKLAQVSTSTFKGRTTAGTGDPEDLTSTQATALLNNVVGDSGSGGTKGLVPAPGAGDAAANKFLKADGSWAIGSANVADGDKGDITVSSSGTVWTIDNAAIPYAKLQNISATQRVLGRNTAGAGVTEEVTATQLLDWLGSTQGQILYRNGTVWTVLSPGTSGQVLSSGGAAANPSWQTVTGTGTVTSVATGCGLTGGTITTTGTLKTSNAVNAQTGTTYTVVDGDCGKLVTTTNASAIAITLPQAGASSSFVSGWSADFQNRGAGTATITPTTSTIDGAATLALTTGTGVRIFSDGTNYFTQRGASSGGIVSSQTVAGSATITIPTGATKARIVMWGGAGGGGGAKSNESMGGPGAGAAALRKFLTGLTPGNTLAWTQGAAGAAGTTTPGDGGAGGNSSLASGTQTITTLTTNGGGGGGQANGAGIMGAAATGGTATNGDVNFSGQNSTAAQSTSAQGAQGMTGMGMGVGGTGGHSTSTTGVAGTAGTAGGVIIDWYN
jgi:hypothetical protein